MRSASAMAGSSIVRILPTRTTLPVGRVGVSEASSMGAAVLAGGESAAGELALLALQPATRTSITRTASLRGFVAAPEAITPVTALGGPDLFDLR
jgi:hypothetical protein